MATGAGVFGSLVGRWEFDRVIEPGVGKVTGVATFRPVAPDRLHYREDGRISLAGGHTAAVFREYVYLLEDDRILVCFADGERPGAVMHTLGLRDAGDAGAGSCGVDVHHCGADVYEGTYQFRGADRFSVVMRVTGPAKDYRMTTGYRRARQGVS